MHNAENRQVKIDKLSEIYRKGVGGGESAAFFLLALADKDYLVRTRAYALAARLGDVEVEKYLLSIIFGQEEREWQLRALNAVSKAGSSQSVAALEPLLFQANKPLLLRGGVWAIVAATAFQPDFTLSLLAKFITSPWAGYLKPGFVADAIGYALNREAGCGAIWSHLRESNQAVDKAASYYRNYRSPKPVLLQVFPYPDYLAKMAAKRNISPRELKRALYFRG